MRPSLHIHSSIPSIPFIYIASHQNQTLLKTKIILDAVLQISIETICLLFLNFHQNVSSTRVSMMDISTNFWSWCLMVHNQ